MYDIIVVGGGPAGLTAALYGLRNGKTVLIIEKNAFGGQITNSPRVENIPGFASISGTEFADRFLQQVLDQGAEIELEKVVSVEEGANGKRVLTEEGGAYEGRSVILATGVRHRLLGLEGEAELIGSGVSFCAVCDGDFYADQTVVVAGGGNSALQEALLLSSKCREVIILQDMPFFTGEKKLQEALFSRPNVTARTGMRITGLCTEEGLLTGIFAENASGEEEVFPCEGLFVAIGLVPENEAFAPLAVLNDYGYFDSDERCLTKTSGVFVAGDCRSKAIRQVTTAQADGAVAALAACRYLDSL